MGQFRLVIVDDEPLVRRGLPAIINRIAPQWEVVGEAANGLEGVTLIRETRPDLAIIDISMPHMDGTALYETLRQSNDAPYCIVLSGHTEFEYVRSMLLMGVLDYLIKPIEEHKILSLLHRVEDLIIKDFQHKLIKNEQNYQLIEYWVHQLIHGNLYTIEECEHQLRLLGIPTTLSFYCINTIHFDILVEKESYRGAYRFFLIKAAQEMIENNGIVIQGEEGHVLLIAWSSQLDLLNELETSFERQFISFVRNYSRINVSIGTSPIFDSFYQFQDMWNISKQSARFKLALPNGDEVRVKSSTAPIADEAGLGLFVALQQDDPDGVLSYIEKAFKIAVVLEDDVIAMRDMYMTLLMWIEQFSQKNGTNLELICNCSYSSIASSIMTMKHSDEFIASLMHFAASAMKAVYDNRTKLDHNLISRVKQYISDNLNNNLSLQNAADYVHMNGNYLSEVFKQATGQNFIDYVIEQRIKLAKRLIEENQLKLYEVAREVGYQSSKHFTVLFKKVVGILPSEYKRYLEK